MSSGSLSNAVARNHAKAVQLLQARITVCRIKCLCRTVLSYSKTNILIADRKILKLSTKYLENVKILSKVNNEKTPFLGFGINFEQN